jgi:hypothetical protein
MTEKNEVVSGNVLSGPLQVAFENYRRLLRLTNELWHAYSRSVESNPYDSAARLRSNKLYQEMDTAVRELDDARIEFERVAVEQSHA